MCSQCLDRSVHVCRDLHEHACMCCCVHGALEKGQCMAMRHASMSSMSRAAGRVLKSCTVQCVMFMNEGVCMSGVLCELSST